MKLRMAVFMSAAMAVSPAVRAAEVAPPLRVTSDELAQMVEKPASGTAVGRLPLGADGPQVVLARRTQSGEVEVHDAFNDLFVVRAGTATVLVGGKVTGQRQIAPGEWRGGTVSGAASFKLGAGDVLWIPAGLPHQVTLPKGGDFTYMAVKSSKAP